MKKVFLYCLVSIICGLLLFGCATIVTQKADPSKKPNGVRVYPPRLYLFVNGDSITPVYIPDYTQAYDIKPLTILAKQEFTIEMDDGKLKKVTANQDNTALQSLLEKAIATAPEVMAKGAEAPPTTLPSIKGTFGLKPGVIYRLDDDGVFRPVNHVDPQ
jgi:hypothetical protein